MSSCYGIYSENRPSLFLSPLSRVSATSFRRRPARRANRPSDLPSLALERFHQGQPFVQPEGNESPVYRCLKRTLDLLGATVLLILLAPILLVTLAILTITTQGHPFFIQERVGYLGRRFPMIKFRTMHRNAAQMQHCIQNEHQEGPIFKNRRDPRITRIGRVLRRTSIDEMPQLINVLLGHMSLVGPRPPVPSEVVQYEPWQRRRLAVMPGLTCLWQVSGRSEIGFQDWVRMDIWYARKQNLWTDLSLLVRTPWSVITCRGAY